MAFNSITTNSKTFTSIGPGLYQKSDVPFGAPNSTLKLSPGKVSQKDGPIGASVTRSHEKDVLVGGFNVRKKVSLSLQLQTTTDFTVADIVELLVDINGFASDPENLRRLLMGEG